MDLMSFLAERASLVLVAGIIGLAILFERGLALYAVYPIRKKAVFFDRLRILVVTDQLVDAVALCNLHRNSPVAQIVREGLMRAHYPEEMIQDGLKLVALQARQIVTRRTHSLLLIGALSILSGILGAGLTLLQSPEATAGAISASLSGLIVAIGCGVSWGILTARTQELTAEIEQASVQTLDILRARIYHHEEARQRVAHVIARSA